MAYKVIRRNMQQKQEDKVSKPALKSKRRFLISIGCLVILICLLPAGILKNTMGNSNTQPVVIRLDDIQDYAFRDAQLFLLNESIINRIPLSLGVIAGKIGEDEEIVKVTKLAVEHGSDIAVHGWAHEDFALLSPEEQSALLLKSIIRIKEILGLETTVFIPPMYSINEKTLVSMNTTGLRVISTFTDNLTPGPVLGILSLPGTVQISSYIDETWHIKSLEILKEEITASNNKYGFTILVTHPQEYLTGDKTDPLKMELYRGLLKEIKNSYRCTTLKSLAEERYLK
jgi:peptidoglycan/xylan/chitin deacetylase (PgdA/CDA1 family)